MSDRGAVAKVDKSATGAIKQKNGLRRVRNSWYNKL